MAYRAGIDLGYFLWKIARNWAYVLCSVLVSLALALGLLYSTPEMHKVATSLMVDDGSNSAIAENLFDGVKLVQAGINTSNEIAVLKSFELVKKTLENIDYKVSYYRKSGFRHQEIFSDRPFSVEIDSNFSQVIQTPLSIKFITSDRFVITGSQDKVEIFDYRNGGRVIHEIQEVSINDTLRFGEYIETPFLKIRLTKHSDFDLSNDFFFVLEDVNALAEEFSKKLSISPVVKDASILKLSLNSTVPDREIAFLDELVNLHFKRSVNNKNKVAQSIIDFIDNQLAFISDSLHTAEMALQNFRSISNVIDIDYESRNLFEELKSLEKQRSEELIKFRYYDYLSKYVKGNGGLNDIIAPSVMGIQDQTLNELITTLTAYTAQMTAISHSAKERNPKYSILQENIENTRFAILENVKNIKVSSQIKLNDVQQRLSMVQRQVDALPENERILLNAQRKFEFNDNIYTYFLQKRGEAAIIKEANIPAEIVVDHARIDGAEPVSPNKKMILIVALALGFVLPVGLIFMKDIVSNKVLHKEDLFGDLSPAFPLFAEIPKNSIRGKNRLSKLDTRCNESFRALKLRIENKSKQQIICCASLVKGDGKTFCANNLAKAFAKSNKRVLLIDINDEKHTLRSEIKGSKVENFTIVRDGYALGIVKSTIPEIDLLSLNHLGKQTFDNSMSKEGFRSLFEDIASLYDYIIIDCPAVNGSADFLLLNNLTHLNLIVVRKNHTPLDLSSLRNLADADLSRYHFLFNCA